MPASDTRFCRRPAGSWGVTGKHVNHVHDHDCADDYSQILQPALDVQLIAASLSGDEHTGRLGGKT